MATPPHFRRHRRAHRLQKQQFLNTRQHKTRVGVDTGFQSGDFGD
ncbi:Uncharacterised protein [Serratia fonticola]|nr:Uncharacterised protein [Serratia fonticola]CAI1223239.1 Uncharacterised protein [Serratia fonticola]